PAVGFRFRQAAAVDVYLQRMQDEPRHWQGLVPSFSHCHEIGLAAASRDMDVVCALLRDGRFPARFAASRLIVVTGEEARLIGKTQYLLDRMPKAAGAAAREIRPRRAAVGHEKRVMDKGGIADHVGDRAKRVSR